jgi:branched-subunit amino acid ABC-type transport system permease component
VDTIVFGIVTGCVILLGAVGFSMTMNSDHFVNVAYGQMLLLGAYLALLVGNLLHSFIPAAIIAIVLTGAIGMGLYLTIFRPVKAKGALILLFTSVGLSYVINGVIGAIAGKKTYSYDIPAVQAIQIGKTPLLTIYQLLVVIIALVSAITLHLFLTRTHSGKLIRAVADNYNLARIRGVNPLRIALYVWFIASSFAAVAGIFSGMLGSLDVELGWKQILIILSATVLGGLGSIYGVMVASILIGLVMQLGILVIPSYYRSAIAFSIIIIVLLIKPEGLASLWKRKATSSS